MQQCQPLKVSTQFARSVSSCSRWKRLKPGRQLSSRRCAVAGKQNVEDIELDRAYLAKSPLLAPVLGPVRPVRLVGMGRGLETTRSTAPGELLLVSQPLAAVSHPADVISFEEGEAPEADGELTYTATDDDMDGIVQKLWNNKTEVCQLWLQQLDNGTPEREAHLPDLVALTEAAGSSSNSSRGAGPLGLDRPQVGLDELYDVVDINHQVEVEDWAVCSLQQQRQHQQPRQQKQQDHGDAGASGAGAPSPSGVDEAGCSTDATSSSSSSSSNSSGDVDHKLLVGLWPEAALINHSCSPNVSQLLMQDKLAVFAARPIGKQGQLYRNYLGPLLLAPLSVRRAALEEQFGFTCRCSRCREEERLDSNLQQLVEDSYEAVTQQLAPDLQRAYASEDAEALDGICDQVAALVEVLDAAFNKLALKQQTQLWVQVSLFKLYELAAAAMALAGESDPRMLELLAALAGEAAPGSAEHIYWTTQYKEAVAGDPDSPFSGALRYAEDLCSRAYKLRYGKQLTSTVAQMLAGCIAGSDVP